MRRSKSITEESLWIVRILDELLVAPLHYMNIKPLEVGEPGANQYFRVTGRSDTWDTCNKIQATLELSFSRCQGSVKIVHVEAPGRPTYRYKVSWNTAVKRVSWDPVK